MATETGGTGSVTPSESGAEQTAGAESSLKPTDILVDSVSGEIGTEQAAGGVAGDQGTEQATFEQGTAAATRETDALSVADLLLAARGESDPDLGVLVTLETIGGDTVVSIDPDGAGPQAALPVVTLENVTGVTLAELLTNNQIVT